MSMPSVMNHAFSKIPAPRIERSSFDRSHGHKTTFDPGYLVPVFVDEILPGDTVNMNATFFARIATLLNVPMDNIFLDTFWFFVPNRILWDKWERFNGAQATPTASIDFEIPYLSGDPLNFSAYSLADYFGIPTEISFITQQISALPFRAYNLIWNEWFKDQNTQADSTVSLGDGPDTHTDYSLLKRGKRHDYFNSCLPWPQKGDAVAVPLGTSAPVIGNGETIGLTDGTFEFGTWTDAGSSQLRASIGNTNVAVGGTRDIGTPFPGNLRIGLTQIATNSGMIADLSTATSATINELREAFAIQQILERDARGGTRYTEILKSKFGVTVPDFRLQRPEYLGGSSQRMDINQVPQTSESGTTKQANLASFGQVGTQSRFVKSFDEHGIVICLANVRADITYQQGLNKMWTRSTRYDFYDPLLAHLGEQAVLNEEIYAQGAAADANVFGYQERWAEMRYKSSFVSGAFRSNHAASLDSWHLALDFAALPELDDVFIEDAPPISRITALGAGLAVGQTIIMDMYFQFRHARPMPVYSTPGLERL